MRAAFDGRDIVRIGIDIFVIAVVVLHADFDKNLAFFSGEINRIVKKDFFIAVQVFDKRDDAAIIMQCFFKGRLLTLVDEMKGHLPVEKSHLTIACNHQIEVDLVVGKNLRIRFEAGNGSVFIA